MKPQRGDTEATKLPLAEKEKLKARLQIKAKARWSIISATNAEML